MTKETLTAKVDSKILRHIEKKALKDKRSRSYITNELLTIAIVKTKINT